MAVSMDERREVDGRHRGSNELAPALSRIVVGLIIIAAVVGFVILFDWGPVSDYITSRIDDSNRSVTSRIDDSNRSVSDTTWSFVFLALAVIAAVAIGIIELAHRLSSYDKQGFKAAWAVLGTVSCIALLWMTKVMLDTALVRDYVNARLSDAGAHASNETWYLGILFGSALWWLLFTLRRTKEWGQTNVRWSMGLTIAVSCFWLGYRWATQNLEVLNTEVGREAAQATWKFGISVILLMMLVLELNSQRRSTSG